MAIYAPKGSPETVASFLRSENSEKAGHVTCFPIYGGFQMNIPEDVFAEKFTFVSQEQYEAMLQKYEPIDVCFESITTREEVVSGYSNGKLWNGWQCPVFTKDEILRATAPGAPGILAPSSFSQTIWHEQSGGFIVVTSQNSDLPEVFDVMPYVERMLDGNFYDDAAGLEISLCRPFDIRVGEQTIQVFDINSQGWCWESTNGLEFDAAGKVIDTASTPAAL